MSTLNIVRLYSLYTKIKASHRSDDAVRVIPLLEGGVPFCFHRDALFSRRSKVASLLSQLPDTMKQSLNGSLQPWIQARYDWKHAIWAPSLSDADLLLAMGRSLQMVSVQVSDYPCTLPHVQILDLDASANERHSLSRNARLSRWDYDYLRAE